MWSMGLPCLVSFKASTKQIQRSQWVWMKGEQIYIWLRPPWWCPGFIWFFRMYSQLKGKVQVQVHMEVVVTLTWWKSMKKNKRSCKIIFKNIFKSMEKFSKFLFEFFCPLFKNPAYGRPQLSRPMPKHWYWWENVLN